jgi:hypothetical protein
MTLFKITPPNPHNNSYTVDTKFALLPTTLSDGTVIWLEKYIEVKKFKVTHRLINGSDILDKRWILISKHKVNETILIDEEIKKEEKIERKKLKKSLGQFPLKLQ